MGLNIEPFFFLGAMLPLRPLRSGRCPATPRGILMKSHLQPPDPGSEAFFPPPPLPSLAMTSELCHVRPSRLLHQRGISRALSQARPCPAPCFRPADHDHGMEELARVEPARSPGQGRASLSSCAAAEPGCQNGVRKSLEGHPQGGILPALPPRALSRLDEGEEGFAIGDGGG